MGEFPYALIKQALKENGIVIFKNDNREKLDFGIHRTTGKPALSIYGRAVYDSKKDKGTQTGIPFIDKVVRAVKTAIVTGKHDGRIMRRDEDSDYEQEWRDQHDF